MDVSAAASGLQTARLMLETQVSLQAKVQDIAKEEMAALLQMVAPPPAHPGSGVNLLA